MPAILHYVHDPLCGWCYAAEAMIEAAAARAGERYRIVLHGGGLFARTGLSAAMREHIRAADGRIADLTGQVFTAAYLDGLLGDPQTIYDSAPPIRGILAAGRVEAGSELRMLTALQRAHYRRGLRIVEPETMAGVAGEIGLDRAVFLASFAGVTPAEVTAHMAQAREPMRRAGGRGFPTFVAQRGERYALLPHERFHGDPQGFAAVVERALSDNAA